ncbi:hypothetical protein [Variovorax saccharolyticus]|uniref:hypothetical protein n=1 Tax=Variovorax saccharolyticus TaxID=3053516 RepID=UPI002577A960|nr:MULTISPECIES: hypothetical protein [unclassified Variovorax]MDM0022731.1 hypothetical protein [Variovorax sp. J22R187]MDM0028468.1 hypothetical protein [Variovorax sp. J31P216]
MEASPLARELIVIALTISGPVGAGLLWIRSRRASAVLCFLLFAAVASCLVARWNITVGL